jgi:hypothetical protein
VLSVREYESCSVVYGREQKALIGETPRGDKGEGSMSNVVNLIRGYLHLKAGEAWIQAQQTPTYTVRECLAVVGLATRGPKVSRPNFELPESPLEKSRCPAN